jgi:membrane associated rhomboid family serine protease
MPDHKYMIKREGDFFRKKLLICLIIPFLMVALMWLLKMIEVIFEIDLTRLGILPVSVKGVPGIILSPFIHHDFRHLLNNTLPFFLLSVALFYFYSAVAVRVLTCILLLTGFLVWLAGREGYHVGASGLVYGVASFLFFSGILRKYYRLVALSLLIVFLYGEMVWGIFPGIYTGISWEAHMLGFFSGIILAIWYREEGPRESLPQWMEETEDTEEETADVGPGNNIEMNSFKPGSGLSGVHGDIKQD